jgi:hypothetical protein
MKLFEEGTVLEWKKPWQPPRNVEALHAEMTKSPGK